MKIEQYEYFELENKNINIKPQWVLVFGDLALIEKKEVFDKIKEIFKNSYIMGCSTAGEIYNNNLVKQESLSITAIEFEKSEILFSSLDLRVFENSYEAGIQISKNIPKENLKHIFVLAEGVNINGSKFVEGIRSQIGNEISITGGLAGDGNRFNKTLLICNDYAKSNYIVLAALYGGIKTSCASYGGWDMFGIERIVTKSQNNILYEIDNKPSLDLYKEYLCEKSKDLPASGLLFPLNIRVKSTNQEFVRTLLGIDEKEKSLIFAGDIPENSYCRLMKANTNNLIDGSKKAAQIAKDMMNINSVNLAILISCVGRKLVLKSRVDEEISAVRDILGNQFVITGFYSYGEIAPHIKYKDCELHNQTMTLSLLTEE